MMLPIARKEAYALPESQTPTQWKERETQTPSEWKETITEDSENNTTEANTSAYGFNSSNSVPTGHTDGNVNTERITERTGTFETERERTGTYETEREQTGTYETEKTQTGTYQTSTLWRSKPWTKSG